MKPVDDQSGRTRTGERAAYWWVHPNFMPNLHVGVMDTNLVLPLWVDRRRVLFDYYSAAGAAEGFVHESLAATDQVQDEDLRIGEDVQRGLNSRSYTSGRFSAKRENGAYRFYQLLGRALGEGHHT